MVVASGLAGRVKSSSNRISSEEVAVKEKTSTATIQRDHVDCRTEEKEAGRRCKTTLRTLDEDNSRAAEDVVEDMRFAQMQQMQGLAAVG